MRATRLLLIGVVAAVSLVWAVPAALAAPPAGAPAIVLTVPADTPTPPGPTAAPTNTTSAPTRTPAPTGTGGTSPAGTGGTSPASTGTRFLADVLGQKQLRLFLAGGAGLAVLAGLAVFLAAGRKPRAATASPGLVDEPEDDAYGRPRDPLD